MTKTSSPTESDVMIRRGVVEDAELLCRLNKSVQEIHYTARPDMFKPHAVTPEMIDLYRARLTNDDIHIFVAELLGEPVGYVVAQVVERPENPYSPAYRFVLIDEMSVNPDFRSRGYGEQLMQTVFALAQSQGIRCAVLNVWAFNERAVAFYKRQGFSERDIRMEAHLE